MWTVHTKKEEEKEIKKGSGRVTRANIEKNTTNHKQPEKNPSEGIALRRANGRSSLEGNNLTNLGKLRLVVFAGVESLMV